MNRLSPGRGRERSHQFLVSHGTAVNMKDVSLRTKRGISSVPRLSWNSCKHERVEKRQERTHQFLGSHRKAANMKELTLRKGK
jgi:hypothetical protein